MSQFTNQHSPLQKDQFAELKNFSWENFYFFSVFGLEAWNFVFLSAIASRLSKRVPKNNPRKTFFCTRKEKKWHLSDIFPSFRQNRSSACVKIQHSTLPNEQLVEKKNSQKFFIFYTCFHAWRTKSCSFGKNRSRLSNCVPKTSPMKKCLWIKKQEEKIENWANFFRTVGQEFRRGYYNCNLNVHRSIDRYYLFLSVFSVFEMFLNLERKSCHTWRFFSAVFSKLFAKSEDHSGMKCFFEKDFVFLLKVYGKVTKKFAFFVEKSMQVVQTAIYISRGFFLTKS